MLESDFYSSLAARALADEPPCAAECERLLGDPALDLLSLVHAAYRVRHAHWQKDVQVHIINNAQNGHCPEDCAYCTQAKTSETGIDRYRIKDDDEILSEARRAYEAGAHRYCMVFAGRGPNLGRTQTLARLIRKIKQSYNLEVCVSAGLIDDDKARVLAEAGLDRLNHNLNTSRQHYPAICSTHSYDDRLATIRAARNAGLEVCSGMIVGMGESQAEVVEVAHALRELSAASIPINFLLPFEGTRVGEPVALTPEYCLRVLCMFRFVNPSAELRISAGRELHLRSLQPLSLYPANSLFLEGYLNAKGGKARDTLQMIHDAGFRIVSDHDLEALLADTASGTALVQLNPLKTKKDLRPSL